MNNNHFCVIMAKGPGKTVLRMTYDRFSRIVPPENIIVVIHDNGAERARRVLPELPEKNLLLEPYSRGTAPCMTYATYTILRRNPNAVIVATPADHIIDDGPLFRDAIGKALAYASEKDVLITLGLVPTRPAPNFGYIQVRGGSTSSGSDRPLQVKTFVEKPDASLAQVFFSSGEFFWNSGIFVWKADKIRMELENYLPEMTSLFEGWETGLGTPSERAFIERAYAGCSKVSLDYGVMEKTGAAWLYPSRFLWADIGSLEELYEDSGYTDDRGNLVFTDRPGGHIQVAGVEDSIILCTENELFVGPRDPR
ncbi:MAG: mannose-1-phosphate guanylyltransferase [Bacteroidales bacterium]|nr:mannose-1-phosphate guanylyltransferase [Bacteroidales bacterium]